MAFNGSNYAGPHDCTEEPRLGTLQAIQKIRYKENEEENVSKMSSYSLKSSNSRDSARNRVRCADQQSGNYAGTLEHERGGGNLNDGNRTSFDDENVWEHVDHDPCSDEYRERIDETTFDVDRNGNPYGNCKSGINISVVSQREVSKKNVEVEPKYNLSFKRCYDSINHTWDKKRRKRTNPDCLAKKENTNRGNKEEEETNVNGSNFHCTFENCCGNCESYIMEIPESDLGAYKNWQNMQFEAGNACFEDCCCPRDMKVYSSNLSIPLRACARQSCVTCVENGKCCPPDKLKCDSFAIDCHSSSKHCLQRVHFTKPHHSSCSFCSRKCTPSKASLFVEIGESMVDVCDLRSEQVFESRNDSTESLENAQNAAVKKNKSDSPRSKGASRKHGDAPVKNCSANCKGRPDAVERGFSDRIAPMEKGLTDDTIEQRTLEAQELCNQRINVTRSNESFQEKRERRAQTESGIYVIKKTTDCVQQCETCGRSLWGDVRKGKLWLQVQDTCKHLVKAATTSIGQLVKQTSRIKRSKKDATDTFTNEICKAKCDETNLCTGQNERPECLHERVCWTEVSDESKNYVHYCQNHCCAFNENSNIARLPDCQKHDYCSHYRNARERTPSNRGWHSDPRNGGVQENVYPSNGGPITDLQRPKCAGIRKRGGSDGNSSYSSQRKKQTYANRSPSSPPGKQTGALSNRGYSSSIKQESTRSPVVQEVDDENSQRIRSVIPLDQVKERTVTYVDVHVQADIIRADVEPASSPVATRTMAYQKSIRSVKQVNTFPDAVPETATHTKLAITEETKSPATRAKPAITQEAKSPVLALPQKEDSKAQKKPPASPLKKPESSISRMQKITPTPSKTTPTSPKRESATKDKPVTKSSPRIDKEVQCEMIKSNQVFCADKVAKEAPSRVEESCVCAPQDAIGTLAQASGPEPRTDSDTEDSPVRKVKTEVTTTDEEDAAEELPAEDDAEETVASAVKEATDVPEDVSEDLSEGVPEDVPQDVSEDASVDVPEAVPEAAIEQKSVEKPYSAKEITALTPVGDKGTDLQKVDLSRAPVEYSRDFHGRRNHVSVEMQTSSTILTKILSEFQVGNKKKQILMSIKFQTTSDGNDDQDQLQAEQSDADQRQAQSVGAEVQRPAYILLPS